MKHLTPALENYLLQIYRLHVSNGTVHVTDIACSMNVSKPSVSRAVRQLTAARFILHENYGPLILTGKGKRYAVQLDEKQTAFEAFLTGILGVEPEIAAKDSRLLGTSVSEMTAAQIRQAVNREGRR